MQAICKKRAASCFSVCCTGLNVVQLQNGGYIRKG